LRGIPNIAMLLHSPNGSARCRGRASHSFSRDPELPNAPTICSRTVRGDRMAWIVASIAARLKAAYLKLRPQRFGGTLMG